MNKKHCILVVFILFNSVIIKAQPALRWADFFLNVRGSYGFIASHKKFTKHIMQSHFSTYEISVGSLTRANSSWGALYNKPEIGIAYWYSNMGQSTYIKQAHGLFPYINFPLNRKKHAISQHLRGGIGIGYISSPFDLNTNYKNIMIGSHINVCANILYELHFAILHRPSRIRTRFNKN